MTVSAQARIPGVTAGDTFTYSMAVSWSSNDPKATPSSSLKEENNTRWVQFVVTSLVGTNITAQMTTHYWNGTEITVNNWVDIDTGAYSGTPTDTGTGLLDFFISANLTAGDSVYSGPQFKYVTINDTTPTAYPSSVRNTNHLNYTYSAGRNTNTNENNYWDKLTGAIVESFQITVNQTGTYVTTSSLLFQITDSNLWTVIGPEKILEVPYQYQYGTEWCGPTCLAMVLRYYGIATHCWNIAKFLGLGRNDGTYISDNKLFPPNLGPKLTDYLENYYSQYDIQYYTQTLTSHIFLDIESDIFQGQPVILSIQNPSNTQQKHFIVITGYNETGFFFNDPSGITESWAPSYVTDLSDGAGIHGYITKDGITSNNFALICANFTNRSGLSTANTGTLLILRGAASPTRGSLELITYPSGYFDSSYSSVYFDRPWPNPRIFLDLDMGLIWKQDLLEVGVPAGCPVLGPDDVMKCHINIYNHQAQSQTFTFTYTITGENGLTYFSDLKIETMNPLGEGSYLQTIPLGDHLTKTQYYHIQMTLFDSNGNGIDTTSPPDFYYLSSGTSAQLQEPGHHLYLHVYDVQGNHVGLNYTTNQTDLEIPGACYYDNLNGTTIIALPTIMDITVVVDASYAEKHLESYTLTMTSETQQGLAIQTYSGSILQSTVTSYSMPLASGGGGGKMPYMN